MGRYIPARNPLYIQRRTELDAPRGARRGKAAMMAQIIGFKRIAAIIIAFQAILWPAQATADAATDWIDGPKADVRLISATTGVGDLRTIPLGVEVRLDEGWKTYWRSPGDAGIPPHVDWEGSANLSEAEFGWPAPVRFNYYDLETFGYEKGVVFSDSGAGRERRTGRQPPGPGRPSDLRRCLHPPYVQCFA